MSETLVPFIDKNSFQLKDSLKELCKGKARFDGEKKVWMVPQGALYELKRLSDQLNENKKDSGEIWKRACTLLGFRFVKKGTTEYDQVLVKFKQLMKEDEEKKEEEEDEEYDEDDVVYD
jgi:hypothetical protein